MFGYFSSNSATASSYRPARSSSPHQTRDSWMSRSVATGAASAEAVRPHRHADSARADAAARAVTWTAAVLVLEVVRVRTTCASLLVLPGAPATSSAAD